MSSLAVICQHCKARLPVEPEGCTLPFAANVKCGKCDGWTRIRIALVEETVQRLIIVEGGT